MPRNTTALADLDRVDFKGEIEPAFEDVDQDISTSVIMCSHVHISVH